MTLKTIQQLPLRSGLRLSKQRFSKFLRITSVGSAFDYLKPILKSYNSKTGNIVNHSNKLTFVFKQTKDSSSRP